MDSQNVFDITPQGGDAPEREDPGFGDFGRTGAPNGLSFGKVFSFGSSTAPAAELNLTGLSGTAGTFDLDAGSLRTSAQTGAGASHWHNHNAEFPVSFDFQQPEQPQLQAPPPPKESAPASGPAFLALSASDSVPAQPLKEPATVPASEPGTQLAAQSAFLGTTPPQEAPAGRGPVAPALATPSSTGTSAMWSSRFPRDMQAQQAEETSAKVAATPASDDAKKAIKANSSVVVEAQSAQKTRPVSVAQHKPPLGRGQPKAASALKAPLKLGASTLGLTLGAGKHTPALASGSRAKGGGIAAPSGSTIANKMPAAPSSLKSAMPSKPLVPQESTKSKEKQCQDLPVEFETPVTDRKRSHDQLESLRQVLAPVQEARGKALMDFEEECGGHLGDDSDAAADVALQNGRRASKMQNTLSEEQWAERTHELISQNSKTKEYLEEVSTECESTMEEVDVLSLRASEAAAEIAFITSSNSAYSLTGHAEKLATMLKQLESEQDDPSNSSVVMIQVQ